MRGFVEKMGIDRPAIPREKNRTIVAKQVDNQGRRSVKLLSFWKPLTKSDFCPRAERIGDYEKIDRIDRDDGPQRGGFERSVHPRAFPDGGSETMGGFVGRSGFLR